MIPLIAEAPITPPAHVLSMPASERTGSMTRPQSFIGISYLALCKLIVSLGDGTCFRRKSWEEGRFHFKQTIADEAGESVISIETLGNPLCEADLFANDWECYPCEATISV